MTGITNAAGEQVMTALSDAEAVGWWLENGRGGDTLTDTGELVADIVDDITPGVAWRIDDRGCVVADTGEAR